MFVLLLDKHKAEIAVRGEVGERLVIVKFGRTTQASSPVTLQDRTPADADSAIGICPPVISGAKGKLVLA